MRENSRPTQVRRRFKLDVRTFPRSLDNFRRLVNARGAELRQRPYRELHLLKNAPIEKVTIDSRPATIATIVEVMPDDSLRVVLQGFMRARLSGKHVALDGFYKYPDGALKRMSEDEFHDFG
jgi:hypothetical protein